MASRLSRDFFARDTLVVARALLGQRLVRLLGAAALLPSVGGGAASLPSVENHQRLSGRIVEVEAYVGEEDQACHARCGRTERNASMYGPPGHAYVYFVYGMHYCLNFVTEREGYPAAVLVRALEPLEGVEAMRARRGDRPDLQLTSGPARLCQALEIDRRFDGADLCAPDSSLFLEGDVVVPDEAVVSGPRVGVSGDEVALSAHWRFCVRGSSYLSR